MLRWLSSRMKDLHTFKTKRDWRVQTWIKNDSYLTFKDIRNRKLITLWTALTKINVCGGVSFTLIRTQGNCSTNTKITTSSHSVDKKSKIINGYIKVNFPISFRSLHSLLFGASLWLIMMTRTDKVYILQMNRTILKIAGYD